MLLEPFDYSLADFKPKALKKARIDSGQSQRTLSEELKVNQSLWSQWESGGRRPTRVQLRQLCELFEKTESYFCGELDARLLTEEQFVLDMREMFFLLQQEYSARYHWTVVAEDRNAKVLLPQERKFHSSYCEYWVFGQRNPHRDRRTGVLPCEKCMNDDKRAIEQALTLNRPYFSSCWSGFSEVFFPVCSGTWLPSDMRDLFQINLVFCCAQFFTSGDESHAFDAFAQRGWQVTPEERERLFAYRRTDDDTYRNLQQQVGLGKLAFEEYQRVREQRDISQGGRFIDVATVERQTLELDQSLNFATEMIFRLWVRHNAKRHQQCGELLDWFEKNAPRYI